MKDFDPPPPPMRYMHFGIGNGTLRPIVVSDSIYRLFQRLMAEARRKAGNPT